METAVVVSRILIWVLAIMLGFKLIKTLIAVLIGIGFVQAMTLRDFDEEASIFIMSGLRKSVPCFEWINSYYMKKAPDYSKRIRAKTAAFNEEEDS